MYLFYQLGSEPAPPSISDSSLSHFLYVYGRCNESSSPMATREIEQTKLYLAYEMYKSMTTNLPSRA